MGETGPFLSTHPNLAPVQCALRKRRRLKETPEWMGGYLEKRLFAPEHAQLQACQDVANARRVPEPEELEV